MNRIGQPAQAVFASGMIGLGILGLSTGNFAMQWQPVPASVPGREALAYASAVLMLVCGIGLLVRRTAELSARILFIYLLLWLLLKVPAVVVAPQMEGTWLGLGEIAVLFAGGWTLFAALAVPRRGSRLTFVTGERGVLLSIYPRLAAAMEAGMLGVFAILVWLPAIVAAPKTRIVWTAFAITWAISAGAWVVAASIAKGSRKSGTRS